MKKKILFLQLVLIASLLFSTVSYAADVNSNRDIPVGGSGQIEMVGTIEPTILSVTMPTFVPFNISSSLSTQNKVISPRIRMKNNSNIPVRVDVSYTKVDLGKLNNVAWSNTGTVNDNQIAIGLAGGDKRRNANQLITGKMAEGKSDSGYECSYPERKPGRRIVCCRHSGTECHRQRNI